ncbi:TTLL7-like protein [Mya arenaria]|uniref:TTLL7-like protein n=1 Tax=Mya arenaria TaxID=6604 RepID=A0ABY7FVQ3_MYAAR|nr:TTLL7-like protein [Mya arenaria]
MDLNITLSSLYARRTPLGTGLGTTGSTNHRTQPVNERGDTHRHDADKVDQNILDEERRLRNQPKAKRKRRKNMITANLNGTRYDVIRQMAEHIGYSVTREDDPTAFLIWNDAFVSTERISDLKPYQRINHFPGMGEVTRKDNLARNMMKMAKAVPEEYNFVPRTWILPSDFNIVQNYMKDLRAHKKSKTFIEYVEKPLLLDGYKFDLRIYVLVTSCDPLRIFLFNDGLVRMSTEKYLPPSENNVFYEKGASLDAGSKRSIKSFNEYLRRNDYDVPLLWRNISDMIVKTMIVAEPYVLHSYRMCRPGAPPASDSVCFEVLGFDVLIDRKLRPWLLEIDFDIKSALIEDTIRLLNIKMNDKKKNMNAQKLEAQKRLFRPTKRVSETADMSEYDKKRLGLERRKEELKELLQRVKKAGTREDYENRNRGRFIRIFPTDDKARQDSYVKLLEAAYTTFMSGRAPSMHKEIQLMYNNKLKPLMSMPSSEAIHTPGEEDEDGEMSESLSPPGSPYRHHLALRGSRPGSVNSRVSNRMGSVMSRPNSGANMQGPGGRPISNTGGVIGDRARQAGNQKLTNIQRSNVDDSFLTNVIREREDELTRRTLYALNDMRIKFPGKIASYWLVKLDSIKRRKVIDIVRSNVRAVLQRTWRVPDVDNLPIYRVFSRVFNRLLWSHGQGLWNCFAASGNCSSWETIFSKSSDAIDETELNCCRRIVQLCKDCLLIVYQFAAEAKTASQGVRQNQHLFHQTPKQ